MNTQTQERARLYTNDDQMILCALVLVETVTNHHDLSCVDIIRFNNLQPSPTCNSFQCTHRSDVLLT